MAHCIRKAGKFGFVHTAVATAGRLFKQRDLLRDPCALGFQPLYLSSQIWVIALHHPVGDHLQEAVYFPADLSLPLLGDRVFAAALNLCVGGLRDVGIQDDLETFMGEQAIREMLDHHTIECRH